MLLRRSLLSRAGKQGARGLGARGPRRGDGYEFAELRGYVAGDDPRHIDWAASARTEDLQVRVLFEDHALTLATCIDGSASMRVGRTRSAYDAACEAARCWFAVAMDQDRCARIAEGYVLRSVHLRGREAGSFCAAHTEDGAHIREALELAAAVLPRDTSLLLVSDFYDLGTLEQALRSCAYRFDVTALLVRDPWHAGLPLSGFVTLRDMENGREARAFIGRKERERYASAVRAREEEIRSRLEGYGMRVGMLGTEDIEQDILRAFGAG
jgi:uncharacterized protein (DUF58 family)